MKYKSSEFSQVLKLVKWIIFITPLVFGQLFNFFQVLDSKSSEYMCVLPKDDYLKYLALQVGRSDMAAYLPYSIWFNLNLIILQGFIIYIMLHEIHVIIVNRKVHKKQSLFVKNKRAMLSFFSILLLLYAVGDIYTSVKKPQAKEQVNFLYEEIKDDLNFFASCGNSAFIKVGDERALIKKDGS